MEWISKIMEVIKLPTKFIFGIFLVSISLMLLPREILVTFHLNEFTNKYGLFIGIISLSSGVIMILEISMYIWKIIKNKFYKSKLKASAFKRIERLDYAEKAILREFFLQGQHTIKLPMDHPVVAGLLNCGILKIVSRHGSISSTGMLCSMQMTNYIDEYLTGEHIDLPENQPTEKEIIYLKNNRPPFISTIEREDYIFS